MTKKNMIRVLVVEDDKETAAYIVKGLTECVVTLLITPKMAVKDC